MPTLLTVGPNRFFCYAGDRDEPPHVHVERPKDEANVMAYPAGLQSNREFNRTEINRIQTLVNEHEKQLMEGWNDFFNG